MSVTRKTVASFAWNAARFEGTSFVVLWMVAAIAFSVGLTQHTLAVVRLIYVCSFVVLSVLSFIPLPFTLCAVGRERLAGAALTIAVGAFSFLTVAFSE